LNCQAEQKNVKTTQQMKDQCLLVCVALHQKNTGTGSHWRR